MDNSKNNYIILFEKKQHKILGRVERDKATLRLSALVAVQIPDGRVSDEVVIQKSKIMNHGTGALDWLKGYAATFCDEDLKIIKREIESLLTKLPEDILETSDKVTKDEVFEKLQEFLKNRINELIKTEGGTFIVPDCFTKENKVYVRTTSFSSFISENREMGWSRIEVLKMLKRNGILENGKGRTYDKKVKVNGIPTNYYVIRIPLDENGNVIIDDADESININEL